MSEVTIANYPDWIRGEYRKFPQSEGQALRSMLAVLAQSYEMLTMWSELTSDEAVQQNRQNAFSCAVVWKEFCRYYGANKAVMKLLLVQVAEAHSRLQDFAQQHSALTFNKWLDGIQQIADTEVSTYQNDRPFFSLVIACYNDGRYKEGVYLDRLLNSVCNQGIAKDEIEVILSDDCSPVPFDDVVETYKDKLNIKRVRTVHNYAPGNTRQTGVDIATGRWLCFADHDDKYYMNALRTVKVFIEQRNEQLYVYSPFNSVDTEEKVLSTYENTMGWCHGKFYNLDNFWKAQNIHFIKKLFSHEDIAICTQVACVLDTLKEKTHTKYMNNITYAWTNNPQSISHSKYELDDGAGERNFLEVYFEDYLKATGYIYLSLFRNNRLTAKYAFTRCLEVLCYAYFYTQGFQFVRTDFKRENLAVAGKYLNDCKHTFQINDNQKIYDYVASNNGAIYKRVRPNADRGVHYIPQQGYKEWLDLIDNEWLNSANN